MNPHLQGTSCHTKSSGTEHTSTQKMYQYSVMLNQPLYWMYQYSDKVVLIYEAQYQDSLPFSFDIFAK